MGVFDRFINAIRITDYDDFDEDEKDFYDDEDTSADEEPIEEKPKKGFFSRFINRDQDDDLDDEDEEAFESKPERTPAAPAHQPFTVISTAPKAQKSYSPKVTPIKRRGNSQMEVCVIKPDSMEDTREIADTLLSNCTVVLNLEGIDVELAQRVIDFTSGTCYSIDGSLQKVSSYIFILTPANVEISGDITDILNGTGNSGF